MADPSPHPVTLRGLRNAVIVRVEETSLRRVAREIGMSPTGLDRFLDGAAPYTESRRKLYRWWQREGHRPVEAVGSDLARLAMELLVGDLPAGARRRTEGRVLHLLEQLHRDEEVAPPPWLAELRADGGEQP